MNSLASHFERTPLIHSHGYASTDERPGCLASLSHKSRYVMQYPG